MQNKTFIDTITREAICMAGSDVAYNNLSNELKAKGEYQFLKRSLAGTPNGIHQGIYILTPSGKLLKKLNWGWPTPDTEAMNQQLQQAIKQYKSMPKPDRLGSATLRESERSLPKKRFVKAPNNWLQLRNTSRSYAFAEMDLFDIRHPVYNKIDKLWFSDSEKIDLVPSKLKIGFSEDVKRDHINRLLRHSHLILGPAAWWDEHVISAKLTMSVKAIKGDLILIHYQGKFHQDANSRWNKSAYQGELLGRAVWNSRTQTFQKFRWVGLGDYTIRKLLPNMHRGSNKTVRIASLLELDPHYASEADLTPFHWSETYPREMRAKLAR